jgi:flagellar biosynthesis/type III secretory pathway chaperone
MDNKTYIYILSDTLSKKINLLDELIELTLLQAEYILETPFDIDKFDQVLPDKSELIEQLNLLDDGFEKIYNHVNAEISTNKIQYKDEIIKLQDLIKQVTEKSTKIQTLEIQNKSKLEIYFSNKKKEIRNYKMSSQSASSYYKNMANQYEGNSYFLDKKK